jgi:hypothetical protein
MLKNQPRKVLLDCIDIAYHHGLFELFVRRPVKSSEKLYRTFSTLFFVKFFFSDKFRRLFLKRRRERVYVDLRNVRDTLVGLTKPTGGPPAIPVPPVALAMM